MYMHANQDTDITYLRICFSGVCENHHPESSLDAANMQTVWFGKEESKEKNDKMRSPNVCAMYA